MKITDELLAAYAAGNVTETERNAVRQYLADNPSELETVMMMMDEDYELDLKKHSPPDNKSFSQRLGDLLDEICTIDSDTRPSSLGILPVMSKAAQNKMDNTCAIRCEGYALRTLGIDVTDGELESDAEKQGLLKADGTALYNIGQLSAQYGLFVSRKYDCTLKDIIKSLKHGDVVIAVIDNTELAIDPQEAEKIDRLYGELPNHALIIKSVDAEQNSIELLNPGDDNETKTYPLDVFMEAWDDSANYLIISNRNHYKPHPVDLSKVNLDDDIEKLQDVFAENYHEVWAQARIEAGWSYGPVRDDAKKTDPNLVPYDLLPQQEKEYCRQMSMESIKLLKKLGWKPTKTKHDFKAKSRPSRQRILNRIDYSHEPDYNSADPGCRFCYEVWEYDNYADDHFFHDVYMNKSAAYKEVRRLRKQHAEEDGDRWDYWWILEVTIKDHNKMMKEIGRTNKNIEINNNSK